MNQEPTQNIHPLRRRCGRVLPLLLVLAVLGTSIPSSSAIGKLGKPWQRKSESESTATAKKERSGLFSRHKRTSTVQAATPVAPTAKVASSQTKPRKKLFSRLRAKKSDAAPTATVAKPIAEPVRVRVRATTTQPKPAAEPTKPKKKREGFFVRLFKPEPLKKKPAPTATIASARENHRSSRSNGPAAPNRVQAPPTFNTSLLAQAKSRGGNVVVNLSTQRAKLYVGGQIALDTPVSTARAGKSTPRGSFGVGQRVRQGKVSTIYKVEMPYWMRLGETVYGMHAGYLPGYPASAGCIRMPYEAAQKLFDATGYGTRVRITGG